MKRHDIRLRKQEFSASRIKQHKDYKQLMRQHQRASRYKTMTQSAVAVVLLIFITGVIYYSSSSRFAEKQTVEGPGFKRDTGIANGEVGQIEFKNEVVNIVGSKALPIGGLEHYENYINENLQYPSAAKKGNIAGKVLVQFLVNRDSSLSDFRILHSLGSGCDEEAIRLIKEGPVWVPASVNGELEEGGMVVPVNFKIDKN